MASINTKIGYSNNRMLKMNLDPPPLMTTLQKPL